MKISVNKGKLADTESEAIILALFEGKELAGLALQIDTKSNGLIGELIGSHDFEAKPSQVSVIYTRRSMPAKRIVLVGLGKHSEFNLEKLRAAFAKAMQHLRALNIKQAVTSIDFESLPDAKDRVAQAVVEGALLGLYQYAPFKTVDRENLKDVEQLTIVAEEDDFPLIKAAVEKAQSDSTGRILYAGSGFGPFESDDARNSGEGGRWNRQPGEAFPVRCWIKPG